MFIHPNKLTSKINYISTILENDRLKISEMTFHKERSSYALIEYKVNQDEDYLDIGKQINSLQDITHPNVLTIHFWSQEHISKKTSNYFRLYFITDIFQIGLNNFISQKFLNQSYLGREEIINAFVNLCSGIQCVNNLTSENIAKIIPSNFVLFEKYIKFIPYHFLDKALSSNPPSFIKKRSTMIIPSNENSVVKNDKDWNMVPKSHSFADLPDLSKAIRQENPMLPNLSARSNSKTKGNTMIGFFRTPDKMSRENSKEKFPRISRENSKEKVLPEIKQKETIKFIEVNTKMPELSKRVKTEEASPEREEKAIVSKNYKRQLLPPKMPISKESSPHKIPPIMKISPDKSTKDIIRIPKLRSIQNIDQISEFDDKGKFSNKFIFKNLAILVLKISNLDPSDETYEDKSLVELIKEFSIRYGQDLAKVLMQMINIKVNTKMTLEEIHNTLIKIGNLKKEKGFDEYIKTKPIVQKADKKMAITKTGFRENKEKYNFDVPENITELSIDMPNTANKTKVFPIFPEFSQKLIFLTIFEDLEEQEIETIKLAIDFVIPEEHSVAKIFLNDDENFLLFMLGGISFCQLYIYNPAKSSLTKRSPMLAKFERKNFGLVEFQNKIFVISGFTDKEITYSCEMYNIEKNCWNRIAEVFEPCINPSVCLFQDKYIFKYGGMTQNKTVLKTIERYTIEKDIWEEIKLQKKNENLIFPYDSINLQINSKEILIFGGQNEGKINENVIIYKPNENIFIKAEPNIFCFKDSIYKKLALIHMNTLYFITNNAKNEKFSACITTDTIQFKKEKLKI